MFTDFIYLQGGLRISLFPLSSSDIFSFVGFLVCFFLKTSPENSAIAMAYLPPKRLLPEEMYELLVPDYRSGIQSLLGEEFHHVHGSGRQITDRNQTRLRSQKLTTLRPFVVV